MDTKRRKELLEAYRQRRPEMGVISLRCKATGESFLGTAADTKAAFNSIRMKLDSGFHPNRRLLELWRRYGGEEGFQCSVLRVLEYDDPAEDHSARLEALREECLAADPQAAKIWK